MKVRWRWGKCLFYVGWWRCCVVLCLCLVWASVLFFFHSVLFFLACCLSASNKKICGTFNWALVQYTRSLIHTWQKKSWLFQRKAWTFDYVTIVSQFVDLDRVQLLGISPGAITPSFLTNVFLQLSLFNVYFFYFFFYSMVEIESCFLTFNPSH